MITGADETDEELDLDAVADDPGQRLGDQGPVAALEPVLREAVRNRDPEAIVIDLDQGRVAQPGLEVGGLASIDRRTPAGCRDYAILLLLARLGLFPVKWHLSISITSTGTRDS